MEFIKKSWKVIVAVVSGIFGLIFLRQFFTKDLRAKLNNADAEKNAAVVDIKLAAVREDINAETNKVNELRAEANKPAAELDAKSREDYWNKK